MGVRNWFRRRPSDDEMREELDAHVAMRAAYDRVEEATARRRLGNSLRTREAMRRVWIPEWWDALRQDTRFTVRTWRRQPGFAVAAVLVLALGLGASVAMFSSLDRILFRPLPYTDPERLVKVGMAIPEFATPGQTQIVLFARGYREHWKPAPEPFAAVTATLVGGSCDVTEQQPERLLCATVEDNFLQTLGVRPTMGRDFTPDDVVPHAPPVAIISNRVWTRRFGADSGAIGRTIELDGKPVLVIGVLPASFAMPAGEADILQPYSPPPPGGHDLSSLTAFGRLKPGATAEQAQAAITPIIEADTTGVPAFLATANYQPRVVPLRDYLVGDAARVAWLLLGSVAGLMLITCATVTNLMLARVAARDREFTVRAALGAGRARLARLAFTESLLLALAGGGLGLLFAAVLLRVFVQLAPSSLPGIDQASLDLRVFVVTAVLAMATGAAVGIWPAMSVLRSRALQYGPRATAAARPRMRFTLVTVQIALTVAMLNGSALLLRTLWNVVSVPLGYQSERVVTMTVALNDALYPYATRVAFFERVLERIREIPGTASATMTSDAFPAGTSWLGIGKTLPVDGQPDPQTIRPRMRVREASLGYFQTFGIPILRGRAFGESDRVADAGVILSESAAQILFPNQDPIGHTVRMLVDQWFRVVGVARDIRNTGPTKEPEPELYVLPLPHRGVPQLAPRIRYFAIRTQAPTADAMAFLKQAVADLDPRLPVTVQPLDVEVARLTEGPRFIAWLLSVFAGLALLLAATGLYGVASYLVTQRTRDIGVRMALGATRGNVARQVFGEAGQWIAAGAVGGALLAWGGSRAIESQLFGVAASDPVSWSAAFVVLGVALLAAVAQPAARAARVDPMAAIRAD